MKVLIIEDNSIWQCKLQIIAEKIGLNVAPLASNLKEAKLFLQKVTPDLIIADIHLNEECIFDLFEHTSYRKIPTIFTTVSQNVEDYQRAKVLECFVFLVKPFHQFTLLSSINLLKNQKATNTKTRIEFVKEPTIETDDLKITTLEIKRFYKLLGDDAVLNMFSLSKTETHILKQRWYELRTFAAIGEDLRLSGSRVQRLYPKIVNKIKTKIINNIPSYKDYLEFTKTKKNKLVVLKNSVELQNRIVKEFDLKTRIDSIEELNTKWKNVLWEKNIKSIEDLLQYSKKDLSLFKKLGPFAVLEIEKAIAKYGFELK